MKKLKKLSFIFLAIVITLLSFNKAFADEERGDIDVIPVKPGDVVYYNNVNTNWNSVKVYLFNDKEEYAFVWENEKGKMTQIDSSDIWEYKIPDDIEENKYDHIIFLKGDGTNSNNENQTIDLGYLGAGYAYISEGTDSNSQNKQIGYWYLYDKTELANLIEECEKYESNKDYYTTKSWAEFSEALNDAKEVLKGEQKVESVETGGFKCDYFYTLKGLAEKTLNLNKEALNKKIQEAEDLINDKYDDDSTNDLKSELQNAKDKLNSDSIELDQLEEELHKLNEKISKEKLKQKIDEATDILNDEDSKYYTDDSINSLKDKVNAGSKIYEDEKATLQDVEGATKNIDDAINELELNKKILEDLVSKANEIDFDKYTDETVEALNSAKKEAEELLNNPDITLDNFKSKVKNLNNALEGLLEKQNEVVIDSNNTSDTSDTTNNTEVPNTGSSILLAIILLSAGAVLLLTTSFIYHRKRVK